MDSHYAFTFMVKATAAILQKLSISVTVNHGTMEMLVRYSF
ncbi:hypothetical protein APHWI1_1439 [Anaplasma phagocytophilum str. ApWI1]|uniref:Uncharacterized protein n=1 Tax=Anaplasma phagocytophilum str. ApWI1 TaxID=1359155 RepID=A0A0F3PZ57_ANAPH|nr:hypothetical protein APHWEB_0082 [Anaplasma phagocytophilum str. Webster]KJV85287.1 hypothetical protein APHWI1_1439 [Anaplasma phagocytophilum str. ApWI1]KKA00777.1 hypothetical protein APHCR_1394 [Anaplasma phagocytophilum str. CR1007]